MASKTVFFLYSSAKVFTGLNCSVSPAQCKDAGSRGMQACTYVDAPHARKKRETTGHAMGSLAQFTHQILPLPPFLGWQHMAGQKMAKIVVNKFAFVVFFVVADVVFDTFLYRLF